MEEKYLFLHVALILGTTFTSSLADKTGSCKVIWLFGTKCSDVAEKLITQIKASPDTYQLKSSSSLVIEATRTSPSTQKVNTLQFLVGQRDPCKIVGEAKMKGSVGPADAGEIYCSMQNLIIGSGLVNDNRYKQITNKAMCPGYDTVDCTSSLYHSLFFQRLNIISSYHLK